MLSVLVIKQLEITLKNSPKQFTISSLMMQQNALMTLLEHEDELVDELMMSFNENVVIGDEKLRRKSLFSSFGGKEEEEKKTLTFSSPTFIYIWVLIPCDAPMITLVSSLYF